MKTLGIRLARSRDETGMTLVEVVVSLLIFALLSLGLLHTLTSILSLSRDSRARQVATNLAAQTIDRAREETDLFDLLDDTQIVVLNGDEFTVTRSSQWVSDPSVELDCGAGGAILRYKRINVEVTWTNMRPSTQPVRADTVINPDERINDPSKGTILVSVLNGDGGGNAGVTVSAQSLSGGATPANVTTDAQGCAYMLTVAPGDYRVRVTRSGYVDVNQQSPGVKDVTVSAGTSASASFQYDLAAAYTVRLASNTPDPVEVSDAMPVTFVSTYGNSVMTGVNGRERTYQLHPFASGYSAYAGTCEASDPVAWPSTIVGTETWVGVRPAPVAAEPGGAVSLDVPMGLIQVTTTGTGTYLRIQSVPDPDGEHPGCSATVNLTFGAVTGTRVIALPYGSWRVYRGTSSSQNTEVTPVTVLTQGDVVGGVVTLDPRVPDPAAIP